MLATEKRRKLDTGFFFHLSWIDCHPLNDCEDNRMIPPNSFSSFFLDFFRVLFLEPPWVYRLILAFSFFVAVHFQHSHPQAESKPHPQEQQTGRNLISLLSTIQPMERRKNLREINKS